MPKKAAQKGKNDPDFWLHVTIDSWQWDYRLGTAFKFKEFPNDPDPLSEQRQLVLSGTTVNTGNAQAVQAGLHVEIRILDDARFRRDERIGNTRLVDVGFLDRVKGGYNGMVFMPDDALPLVLAMLLHGRYGHMDIGAFKEGRLTNKIQSYEFTKSMPDGWNY